MEGLGSGVRGGNYCEERGMKKEKKDPKRPKLHFMGVGIDVGVAHGVALDNIAVGIAVGVAIGAAMSVRGGR